MRRFASGVGSLFGGRQGVSNVDWTRVGRDLASPLLSSSRQHPRRSLIRPLARSSAQRSAPLQTFETNVGSCVNIAYLLLSKHGAGYRARAPSPLVAPSHTGWTGASRRYRVYILRRGDGCVMGYSMGPTCWAMPALFGSRARANGRLSLL